MIRFRFIPLLALASTAQCTADRGTAPDPTAGMSVQITPASPPSLALGHSLVVTATVRSADNTVLTHNVVWSSSQPSIATVSLDPISQSGTVTAFGVGTAVITATHQSARDSVFVTVRPPGPVATVSFAPFTETILAGATYSLQVTSRDSDGVLVTPHTIAFQSSDPSVAQVASSGQVTGIAPGDAALTVTSDGASVTGSVRVLPPPTPARAVLWTAADGLRDLGTLPGYSGSFAAAINASGTVVGFVTNDPATSAQHAFIWTASGGMRDLGGLVPGGNSAATDINSGGQVVGWATTSGFVHAVLWATNGTIRDLGSVTGGASGANGINDMGQVVGWVNAGGGVTSPFIWTDATGITLLPIRGVANGVNKLGQVVGTTSDGQPFTWSAASGVTLLAGNPAAPGGASAVDDAGDVVGWSGDATCDPYYGCYGTQRATFWPAVGSVVNITTSAGTDPGFATALGLNNRGQVVGVAANGHAFLWSSTAGLRALGVLAGHTRTVAVGVNDAGQVVGTSSP